MNRRCATVPTPYNLAGIRTLCRRCHIERHRPDDMTPGRADWLEMVEKIAYGSLQG